MRIGRFHLRRIRLRRTRRGSWQPYRHLRGAHRESAATRAVEEVEVEPGLRPIEPDGPMQGVGNREAAGSVLGSGKRPGDLHDAVPGAIGHARHLLAIRIGAYDWRKVNPVAV